ncbi:hypothetical protein R69619_03666 [Paraburkholderia nemoris]|uniref:helix-turn-helix transcriptional regulator n=1 Tax=Paraburkholderia nemoris TaxID=2793076 RepID=UPI00190B888A|nr:AlpA family phage regulatory protein [Paraburkholderia nemoris]CAE6767222.1 hypothetical protein R69619_03666 [Paraburkholderia nemoris]
MTQKTLLATGAAAKAKQPLSPIAQIRRGLQPLSAYTSDSAHPPMSTDSAAPTRTIASTTYSTNIPLLDQVIGWARSRARDRYIKEQEVVATIGRSKAAMRRDVSLGLFPAPVKTGIKSTRWRESEVMAWVEATTILSRVANPGFSMEEFVAALMTSRVPM